MDENWVRFRWNAHQCYDETDLSCAGSISLPLLDSSGSVQAARLKQHGRRCLPFSFEIVFSIRTARVSMLRVSLIQRIHSQRAIGVMSAHLSLTFWGAPVKAWATSSGTSGSGQS